MEKSKKLKDKIHFMGIGGAGISAVAQIARFQGYAVSGCDLQEDTPYIKKVKKLGITTYIGHNESHLKDVGLLAVTPAVFYQSQDHPEVKMGHKREILMTWQEFLGKYLHKNKFLICVAGAHGKSTTTTMAGLLLEAAGFDPTVEVGATVPDWHSNVRLGEGKYFISEADEFYNNFLNYHPNVIILNNIELDHPEFFHSEARMINSFKKFILGLRSPRLLIANMESPSLADLLKTLPKNIKIIGYSLTQYDSRRFPLSVPGDHNKANAMGVIALGRFLKIPDSTIAKTLRRFKGIERRIETIGKAKGRIIIDDYAVHPTAYRATISAAREKYPKGNLWAVIEPHTFSRNRALLHLFPEAVNSANRVIVSRIFASREKDPGDFTGEDIVKATRHPDSIYIPEFDDICDYVKAHSQKGDIVLVMGAGDSYKLARSILWKLKRTTH